MATTVLTSSDFVSNSNAVQARTDGSLFIEREETDDYLIGIVSRESFDLSAANKTLRIVFKAQPFSPFVRSGTFGSSFGDNFAFLTKAPNSDNLWSGNDLSDGCQKEDRRENVDSYQRRTFYGVDTSSTHTIVKSGSLFGFQGSNDNAELDLEDLETISQIATGAGFTIALRQNGTVTFYGSDRDGDLALPTEWTTVDENMIVDICAGEDFYAAIFNSGNVSVIGLDIGDDNKAVQITGQGNNLALLHTDGTFDIFGDNEFGQVDDKPNITAKKVSCGEQIISAITENGEIITWGKDVDGTNTITGENGNFFLDVVAGNGWSIGIVNNLSFVEIGNVPSSVNDVLTGTSGSKKTANSWNDAFENYPMLQERGGFNIMFGIQKGSLPESMQTFSDISDHSWPIIVGSNNHDTLFEAIPEVMKGTILSKDKSGQDFIYDIKGTGMTSGHIPLEGSLITNGEEKYEMTVSFSPIGKVTSCRKLFGGYSEKMQGSHMNLSEAAYSDCRIALYIRNCSAFEIDFVEITDETDPLLVPLEVIYRDNDVSVMQTKASALITDIMDSVEALIEGQEVVRDKIVALTNSQKNNFDDIYDRLENLED